MHHVGMTERRRVAVLIVTDANRGLSPHSVLRTVRAQGRARSPSLFDCLWRVRTSRDLLHTAEVGFGEVRRRLCACVGVVPLNPTTPLPATMRQGMRLRVNQGMGPEVGRGKREGKNSRLLTARGSSTTDQGDER